MLFRYEKVNFSIIPFTGLLLEEHTKTVLLLKKALRITFNIVCVFPVPGGP